MVISGSATRRSSLALGSVVRISSCLNSEAAMLLNIASRCALVRLNLRPDLWWRIVVVPLAHHAVRGDDRGRPVFKLHAEGRDEVGTDIFTDGYVHIVHVWSY